jgi:hypothetical protein
MLKQTLISDKEALFVYLMALTDGKYSFTNRKCKFRSLHMIRQEEHSEEFIVRLKNMIRWLLKNVICVSGKLESDK